MKSIVLTPWFVGVGVALILASFLFGQTTAIRISLCILIILYSTLFFLNIPDPTILRIKGQVGFDGVFGKLAIALFGIMSAIGIYSSLRGE